MKANLGVGFCTWKAKRPPLPFRLKLSRPTDRAFDAHAVATYQATMKRMVGVPARTAEDALAALDWLIRDVVDFSSIGDDELPASMLGAVKNYTAGTAKEVSLHWSL